MNNLIKRFKEDLQLAGYAKRSIESYVSSVLRLQRFYNKPLEDITEEQLRQYWLCCQSEFGWSAATLRISYAGIQHFFSKTLVRSWNIFNEIKWKREQTLPTILSLQEVKKIIYALPTQQSHTFYLTLYSLGLRLREATTLQVRDILSDRGLVHIHAGKGEYSLRYLSRYVFRVAISNNRIKRIENHVIHFQYKDRQKKKWNSMALDAMEFIRRFLQHVLPKGFMKIRHYGFLNPNCSLSIQEVCNLILFFYEDAVIFLPDIPKYEKRNVKCSHCGKDLKFILFLSPISRWGPPG